METNVPAAAISCGFGVSETFQSCEMTEAKHSLGVVLFDSFGWFCWIFKGSEGEIDRTKIFGRLAPCIALECRYTNGFACRLQSGLA